MEKSRQLGTELLGKRGAGVWRQPVTAALSLPAGTQPRGTTPLAKPGRGLRAPLGFACSGCPQPGCHLCPTLPHPPKGEGGWQLAEDGWRGSKAKPELSRLGRGRDPNP